MSAGNRRKLDVPGSCNRRKVLKGLGGAGGVALTGAVISREWMRPVVDAVVLPAHAQTSESTAVVAGGGGGSATMALLRKAFDYVIPEAKAASGYIGCVSFQYTVDSSGHVSDVMLAQLAPPCQFKKGSTYDSAKNEPMTGAGADWSVSILASSDTNNDAYNVSLHFTNTKAGDGEKFGEVSIKRNNHDPYITFDALVGHGCAPQVTVCP